ncbi:MAG: adenylate/guanylate cyclase domain-containing protein [Firmicutes bacterium]|nr:adenylate/guanylate cyclase domain-containing protein [Bacillota bacterium]
MKQIFKIKRILSAFIVAAAATAVAASGLLYRADNSLDDALYQQEKVLDGNIFVIGIDARSLEELGPFQTWGRSYMAQAVDVLNSDPECRPAVIGIDVLYAGYTDEEEDNALVEALGRYGNVVTAGAANFTSTMVTETDGSFYMDDYYVDSYDAPFDELAEVTTTGHINAMYDVDGIMRHAIQSIDLPDGNTVYSFGYEIYKKYCEHHGIEADAAPPVDKRNNWYISYSGKPGAYYDDFSFSDLMNGNIPVEIFADAVVLIGPYAAGMMDYVVTSIDHSQVMYGVEYQANVVDALLRNEFKQEVSDTPQLAALFIVVFLLTLLSYKQKVKISTLLWLIVVGGYVAAAKLFYNNGYLLHILWIPAFATFIYITLIAFNYFKASKERRQITNIFKHYVAPEIVNELLKNKEALELGGKMTDIACLFVDIRGFTPMSELLTPPQVVEILNRYLDLTSGCIIKNGGTLDKFVGDATMAIFNAPLPQEDYIYKAVKTALDMVENSKQLSEELQQKFGRTVQFGIGVHCGQAVVGNIGASIRMDYTAIGDTVNTAARLEANALGGQVLISRAVADALEGRIKVTSLGNSIKLKGKSEDFEILRLDGLVEE